MIYLTYKINPQKHIRQEDLFDIILNDKEAPKTKNLQYTEHTTILVEHVVETKFNQYQCKVLYGKLKQLVDSELYKQLIAEGVDNHYTTFKIPKNSGGYRTIEAPDTELKTVLKMVKDIMQNDCQIIPHNAAFAYIPKRSTVDALKKHQYNKSRHYLHLDLKDFFTSCDAEFIHKQLKQIFPFSYLYDFEDGKELLTKVVNLALYKGHLPQGTPLSPYLTNLLMVPIDYALNNLCKQRNKQHFVYTRYADDIDISSVYEFDYKKLLKEIEQILQKQTPLKINYKKVHYGTTAGQNWHLGLIINKENKISIGNRRKRELKVTLLNYCKHKADWSKEDKQSFRGELAYFRNIEPDYHDYLIKKYSDKYNNGVSIISELQK